MIDKNAKNAASVSYITIIGAVVGFFLNFDHKNEFAYFHIRQAVGLHLTFYFLLFFINGFDSWMISSAFYLFFFILWLYGFVSALNNKTTPVPLLGEFYQKVLKNIIGNS